MDLIEIAGIFIMGIIVWSLAVFIYKSTIPNIIKYCMIICLFTLGLVMVLYGIILLTFHSAEVISNSITPNDAFENRDCLNAIVQIVTLLGSVITASFTFIFKNKVSSNDINLTDEIKKTHDSKKIKIIKKNNVKQKNKVIIVKKKRFKTSSTLWILSILYVFIGIFIIFNKINLDSKVLNGITIISIGLAVASFAYTTTQDINSCNSNKEIDDKLDIIDKKLDTVIKNTHKKRMR